MEIVTTSLGAKARSNKEGKTSIYIFGAATERLFTEELKSIVDDRGERGETSLWCLEIE